MHITATTATSITTSISIKVSVVGTAVCTAVRGVLCGEERVHTRVTETSALANASFLTQTHSQTCTGCTHFLP